MPGIKHAELPLPDEVEPYAALTELPPTDEPFENVSIFARLRWWKQPDDPIVFAAPTDHPEVE